MRVYIKYEPAEFTYPEDMKKIVSYLREHGSLQVSETTVECQRQYEIVRKRRRNFVVFRRGCG